VTLTRAGPGSAKSGMIAAPAVRVTGGTATKYNVITLCVRPCRTFSTAAPVAKPQSNKVEAAPAAAVIAGSNPAATPAANCSGDNCDGKGAAASAPQAAAASQKAQAQSGVAAAAAVPSATAQTAQAGASEPSSLTGAPGPRCSAGGGSSCTCEEGWAGNNCVRVSCACGRPCDHVAACSRGGGMRGLLQR
jgi:hypothetical protein